MPLTVSSKISHRLELELAAITMRGGDLEDSLQRLEERIRFDGQVDRVEPEVKYPT